MLTTGIKVKVALFLVVALVAAGFLAINYGRLNIFGSGYTFHVSLPASGGLFKNGEVTYRGVPVGRIDDLRATADGVVATVHVNSDAPPIPADVQPHVHDRSVIGEQYLDLTTRAPGSSESYPSEFSSGWLSAGDTIHGTRAALPPRPDTLLRSTRDFVASVPQKALNTDIDEVYQATHGTSMPFDQLLDTTGQFEATANRNFLATVGLINSSKQVLRTQQASAASIRGFSHDLDLLARTMKANDPGLDTLITRTPASARQIELLFREVGKPLGTLMGNLVSTAQIFGVNASGVQDTLIRLPGALSIGFATNGPLGQDLGLTTTFFDPLPCTKGYEGTELRAGLQTGKGQPFNLDAGCTMSPSSGTDVRGPAAVASQPASSGTRVRVASSLGELMGGTR